MTNAADTSPVSVVATTQGLTGVADLTFSGAMSCCYSDANHYCTTPGTMQVVFDAQTGAAVGAEANCLTADGTWFYATWGGYCTTDLCNFNGEIRCDNGNSCPPR